MPTQSVRWRDLDQTLRDDAVAGALAALRNGGLAIVPTDTVYGLAASTHSPQAVARLLAARPDLEQPLTWHAGSLAQVLVPLGPIDLPTRVHRRLLGTMLPGPVRFVLEQAPDRARAWFEARGLGAALLLGPAGEVAIRIPAHAAARAVFAPLPDPIVAIGIGAAPEGFPTADAAIDDGPSPEAQPAATLRLARTGAFTLDPAGRITQADVMAALTRTIVFVCTGNTCRSPMAAALATRRLRSRPEDGITTRVLSAGLSAGPGAPATDEAVRAVAGRGADLRAHRAARVTRDLLRHADAVYTMTAAHLHALRALDPTITPRSATLDPSGDIEDPIGGPLDLYERTADRLDALVGQRLAELDAALDRPPGSPRHGAARP